MKIKVPLLMLVAICAVVMCVRFAQSTTAQDLPSNAKRDVTVKAACADIGNAEAAFKAERFEQAIEAAKQVLSTSACFDDRTRAYTLLISSVRSSQGYDTAIKRAEGVYAYVLKTRPSNSQEIGHLKSILADLKQRRVSYKKTISDQKKIINAHPKSERAAQAALKIATCKQNLGSPADALAAYEEVIRNYPLTRSGWKAAQEVALLRQNKPCSTVAISTTNKISIDNSAIENGLESLREGRASEAERIARQLIASQDYKSRGEAVELLIRAVATSAGPKAAAKQAWQMACGSSEFTPGYSDVLRLEACVADFNDQPLPAKENKAEEKSDAKKSDVVADIPSEAADNEAVEAAVKDAPSQTPAHKGAPIVQAAVPQGQMGLGGMPGAAWPGTGVGNSKKTSRPNTITPSPRVEQPAATQPITTQPTNPSPVQPLPGYPHNGEPIGIGDPQPIPYFDQWTCSKEYDEAGNDLEKIRGLVEENIEKAKNTLLNSSDVRLERRGLGVVLGAAMCAFDTLGDKEWALSICDEYVLPHIESASPESYRYLAKPLVLGRVVRMWTGDGKYDESIEMLNKMLDDESDARQVDAYRVRISQVCDLAGRYEDAIAYLRAIDDKGDLAGAKQAIPELEKKIKEHAQ